MTTADAAPQSKNGLGFVAINTIRCTPECIERFESLFGARAHAIDRMPGFLHMEVIKPAKPGDPYLIVSHWDNEETFKTWTNSPEFIEGHKPPENAAKSLR